MTFARRLLLPILAFLGGAVGVVLTTHWTPPPVSRAVAAAPADDPDVVRLSPKAEAAAGFERLTVGPGDISAALRLPATVTLSPNHVAEVTTRVPGVVASVDRSVGDTVQKGDVLAVVRSPALAGAQLELQMANERLEEARITHTREDKLWREGLTTERAYVEALHGLHQAEAEQRAADRKIQLIGASPSFGADFRIVSPLSGTIIERHVGVGEVLREDHVVFSVGDLRTLWIHVAVYPPDLSHVQTGQPVRIVFDGVAAPIESKVAALNPTADGPTQSIVARVVIESPPAGIRPGLHGVATVTYDHRHVPRSVPQDAVVTLGRQDGVYSSHGDGVYRFRRITRGVGGVDPQGRAVTEVTAGLEAGETIIGRGAFVLKSTMLSGTAE